MITSSIRQAEQHVVKSMCQMGITDSLIKGGVLARVKGKLVLKNVLYCGVTSDESPDELDIFDIEDLERLPPYDLAKAVGGEDQIEDITNTVSEAIFEGKNYFRFLRFGY